LAIALLPWPLSMRIAALTCVVPLAASIEHPLRNGDAEVTVLDVGEGTAIVARTAGHVLVYGTGDSYGTAGRMAETIVAPYLRSVGARAIDRVVLKRLSSVAGDGLTALWAEMPVRQTLVGRDNDEAAYPADDPATLDCASAPSSWRWDGVAFEFRERDAGPACTLSVSTGQGEVVIQENRVMVAEAGGARWLVVSGRRAQRAAAKFALPNPELEGTTVLAAADVGAIRVRLHSARGPDGAQSGAETAPEGYRARRGTLWSASP
jgi:competence protein ComEC